MKKRFRYLIVLLAISQIFSIVIAQAQEKNIREKKVIFQIEPSLSIPIAEAGNKLNVGASIGGSVHFSLSNSFKIGPDLSYQTNSGKESFKNFNAIGLNFDVIWFPKPLFKDISKNKESVFYNLYIGLKMGHNFTPLIHDDRLFNIISQYIGYLIPLKNQDAINIKLSTPAYILKKQPHNDENESLRFINISVGYVFR